MDVGDIKPFNWGQIFSYRKHTFNVGFYGGEEACKKLFSNIIPEKKAESPQFSPASAAVDFLYICTFGYDDN